VNKARVLNATRHLEKAQRFLGVMGGVYLIHARKQSVPMTLSRHKWLQPRGRLVTGSFARSASRTASQNTSSNPTGDKS